MVKAMCQSLFTTVFRQRSKSAHFMESYRDACSKNFGYLLVDMHPESPEVYIHPFYNGNGRTARLLMNFVLMRRGFQPIILPEVTRDEKKRYSFLTKFVYIHPFYNGNGRTARLLMNFVLMRRGFQPIILPEETRDEKKRYSIWRTIAIRKGIGSRNHFFKGALITPLSFLRSNHKFLTEAPIYFCGLQLDILLRLTSPIILSDLNIDSNDSLFFCSPL
ncbi:hypothetical protein niasHS_011315 [Heterodera schachtii]|uniref:Fido domain-containing protein n=1 Tax=Heterodera schachtii TaxID=97005 RepID=A0ABD2J483_HETSC